MIELQKKLYTVDDFDRYRDREANIERLLELVHGEIFEKVPTEKHGTIVTNIVTEIKIYLKKNPIGRVGVEINYRSPTDPYNDRIPDASFARHRERPIVDRGSVQEMPDLAVEVKSPGNSYISLRAKAEYSLQNGCQLVWLVYPETQTVEVCTLTDEADEPRTMQIIRVEQGSTIDGGDLLPGFTLTLNDIFDYA